MKRRQAIKSLMLVGSGLAASRIVRIELAQAEEIVGADNVTAKALKYVPDASQAGERPDKAGVKGSEQICGNCQFAVGEARKVEGHEGEYVPCQLFQKNLVNTAGWCTGWAPKVA